MVCPSPLAAPLPVEVLPVEVLLLVFDATWLLLAVLFEAVVLSDFLPPHAATTSASTMTNAVNIQFRLNRMKPFTPC